MCAVFPPHPALSKTKELRGKGDLPLPKNAPWQVSKSGYRLKLRLTFMQALEKRPISTLLGKRMSCISGKGCVSGSYERSIWENPHSEHETQSLLMRRSNMVR